VVDNRTRLLSGVAHAAFKLRAGVVERGFALILDRGGMRRAWLRGRKNLHGWNLDFAMRLLTGAAPSEVPASFGLSCRGRHASWRLASHPGRRCWRPDRRCALHHQAKPLQLRGDFLDGCHNARLSKLMRRPFLVAPAAKRQFSARGRSAQQLQNACKSLKNMDLDRRLIDRLTAFLV
jgi:hypothetical protein